MRKVKDNPDWIIPKTRRTDFTKEEMLDIIDFYLQYKPMLENQDLFNPHDFTMLLYMYEMLDVEYQDNIAMIKKKYISPYQTIRRED